MKKKYYLLLYALVVFVFLLTSIFYSNTLVRKRNEENLRVHELISAIQNDLLNSRIYLSGENRNRSGHETDYFVKLIDRIEDNSKQLFKCFSNLKVVEDDSLHTELSKMKSIVASLSRIGDSLDVQEQTSYNNLELMNRFKAAANEMTNLEKRFLDQYKKTQEDLDNLENMRIGITIVLFFSLFLWLFIYMKRNDKYHSSLKDFNERYRTYFQETHEGIFRLEFKEPIDLTLPVEEQAEKYYEHGFVAECNESFAKMYGSTIEDVVGTPVLEYHGFDNFKKNFNAVIEFVEEGFRTENQITIETDKHGVVHYFSNNAFGIIENGKLLRVWGTQREITSEMMESNEKKILLRAVEQSQVSIVITDLNGNIEYVNPKFEEVTGYTAEEVLGRNPRILKSGLDYESTYKELWETISSGKTWNGTLHNKRKNGDLFFESTSISPIADESGRIRHFVAVKEDITELTEAQHELNNYKDYLEDLVEKRTIQLENRTHFLRTLIDTIPNPVFVKDRSGKYTDVNKAFIEFFGVGFEDAVGKTVNEFADQEVVNQAEQIDRELIEEYGTKNYESYAFDKNGRKVPVRIFKASFGRKGEEVEGIAGLMIDISESKKTEDQMKKALEQEKELNEMKTNFISIASHELRTPLTAIYSSTELLEMFGRKWTEEKYLEHISRIKYSVDNLTNLMEDLLTLSRVDTGKIKFDPASLNLKSFIERTIHNLEGLKLDTHQLNIQIKLSSEHYILDKRLINYIIQNLLSNAFKYSPKGGEIKLDVFDDNEKIYIKIRDEGIGIAESEMDRLFEPFHRAKNASNITGTGLGLSIVKEAVELHRGQINVKSVENEWTEFEIYLPIIN